MTQNYLMMFCILPLLAYLLGSIPFGFLLGKSRGIDIRIHGSGNIGSTNVKRVAGRGISILTQIGDILKGLIPVTIAIVVIPHLDLVVDQDIIISLTALAAIAGHDFTPFLRFRGGKGANTTLGAFLPIALIPVLVCVFIFLLLRLVTPIVSIRTLASVVSCPVIAGLLYLPIIIVLALAAAAGLIVLRHKDNIKRLVAGTEC